jgi:carboxymethylenebutenolidase
MHGGSVRIETPEGVAPCRVYHPERAGTWPAVIWYMDGMGIRPSLLGMAQRLAAEGYCVLVPDLYYRGGAYPPFDHATLQDDPAEQARIMELVRMVTNAGAMGDTAAFLDFFDRQPEVRGRAVGCVGYCMGGPLALCAAGTFPERIAAAASFHGANLATDRPDSPHLLAPKIRARVYVGVAEIDPYLFPGETPRIDAALREAGVDYTLEMYPGRKHGFALDGSHGYEREAYERHWQRLLDLFRATL